MAIPVYVSRQTPTMQVSQELARAERDRQRAEVRAAIGRVVDPAHS